MAKKDNIYELVTKQIIKKMKQGVIPWRRPWGNKSPAIPTNLLTRKPYRGVNILRLMAEDKSAWWASPHQIAMLGGEIHEGVKPVPIISMFAFEDEDSTLNFRATSSEVYNLDDCEHLCAPYSRARNEVSEIEACEAFIEQMPKDMPKVRHGGNKAAYYWSKDKIRMPARDSFDDSKSYYATLFHEYGHSTGHPTRLNRAWAYDPSDEERAREELVAELTSAFVCTALKIPQPELSHAAHYIKNWLSALENDPKEFVAAAAQAQKAADFLHGLKVKANKTPKFKVPFWHTMIELEKAS